MLLQRSAELRCLPLRPAGPRSSQWPSLLHVARAVCLHSREHAHTLTPGAPPSCLHTLTSNLSEVGRAGGAPGHLLTWGPAAQGLSALPRSLTLPFRVTASHPRACTHTLPRHLPWWALLCFVLRARLFQGAPRREPWGQSSPLAETPGLGDT